MKINSDLIDCLLFRLGYVPTALAEKTAKAANKYLPDGQEFLIKFTKMDGTIVAIAMLLEKAPKDQPEQKKDGGHD